MTDHTPKALADLKMILQRASDMTKFEGHFYEDQVDCLREAINTTEDMYNALKAVAATYRTFRDVPKDEQEWTPADDEALEAAFDAITKAEGRD